MSLVHSISRVEMSYMRQRGTHWSRPWPGAMDKRVVDAGTHGEQQGRNGSAAPRMNHSEKMREMAFPRPGKKQPERETQRRSRAGVCVSVRSAHTHTQLDVQVQGVTEAAAVQRQRQITSETWGGMWEHNRGSGTCWSAGIILTQSAHKLDSGDSRGQVRRSCTNREDVKREPLTPPKVERATAMGMIHDITPSSFSPKV